MCYECLPCFAQPVFLELCRSAPQFSLYLNNYSSPSSSPSSISLLSKGPNTFGILLAFSSQRHLFWRITPTARLLCRPAAHLSPGLCLHLPSLLCGITCFFDSISSSFLGHFNREEYCPLKKGTRKVNFFETLQV